MIFSVTAKRLISYDSASSDGKLWKQFDAFLRGLLAFPLYIPGTAFYKCMQGRKNVMRVLRELLEERKKASRRESTDFIDLLIDDLKDEKHLMNERVALDLFFLLLFAGFETTSSGITAALRFLTDDPKALQELTEEHDNIRKRRADPDSEITWEEYKSMKFTSHVTRFQKDQRSWLVLLVFTSILQFTRIPMRSVLGGGRILQNQLVAPPRNLWPLEAGCGYVLVLTLLSCKWLSFSIA